MRKTQERMMWKKRNKPCFSLIFCENPRVSHMTHVLVRVGTTCQIILKVVTYWQILAPSSRGKNAWFCLGKKTWRAIELEKKSRKEICPFNVFRIWISSNCHIQVYPKIANYRHAFQVTMNDTNHSEFSLIHAETIFFLLRLLLSSASSSSLLSVHFGRGHWAWSA